MTKDDFLKLFTSKATCHPTMYWITYEIGHHDLEEIAKAVEAETAVQAIPAYSITPESLTVALIRTEGRYESAQDRAAALLKKLTS